MRIFSGTADLRQAVPADLGVTEWVTINQGDIDAFAAASRDDQWIHTDPERAASGPFGATVAHGLFTLSLLPFFATQLYRVDGAASRINYGYDRVRFPAPVRVGSRIRAHAVMAKAEVVPGGTRATVSFTIEIDGSARPACVADAIVQLTDAA